MLTKEAEIKDNDTDAAHYLMSLVVSFTFIQLIVNCFQHFSLLLFCFQVLFVSVYKQYRITII